MGAVELYLVRHAQAAGRDGDDPGLSERGRAQAGALGARLAARPFAALLHSPRRRAEETARIVSSFLTGTAVSSSPLLDDRTPVPSKERRDEYPPHYHQALRDVPAHERDVDAVVLREAVSSLVACAEEQAARGPLPLVTHAFVIGWFVRSALQTAAWRWIGLESDNTRLTVIRYPPEGPFLVAFNDTGHLAALERRSASG